ncbi:MAG: carboxypeptidase-like regulatory domain-containing protein, partial [Candidatus Acidiferrum sp.]
MAKRLGSYWILALVFLFSGATCWGQGGNSGSIEGVVKDSSGAVVANATVEISDPVSGYERKIATGSDGSFQFTNVPFNSYHTVVTATGFAAYTEDVNVRSGVPVAVPITLKIGAATTSVTVEANGGDLVENDST